MDRSENKYKGSMQKERHETSATNGGNGREGVGLQRTTKGNIY